MKSTARVRQDRSPHHLPRLFSAAKARRKKRMKKINRAAHSHIDDSSR
jgi:hypothetical protein